MKSIVPIALFQEINHTNINTASSFLFTNDDTLLAKNLLFQIEQN